EALGGVEEMAEALNDSKLAAEAREAAERTARAVEQVYWLPERGFYAFATNVPRAEPREADPGPNRAARQQRMNELDRSKLFDEETVLPAVPLWFEVLNNERAQAQIDRLGSARMATDWGARLLADDSRLYDPLSYHHGSVWPLFTGWASVGAYRYGRPAVGLQALMSNVLLRRQWALGYVTELLSGDFNAPFGRSSHHQVWSEAMTVTPLVRGLLGLEVSDLGKTVSFAPQLPADWPAVEVRGLRAGPNTFDVSLARGGGLLTVRLRPTNAAGGETKDATTFQLAPAFPLDARVRSVRVDGRNVGFRAERVGDVRTVEFAVEVRRPVEVRVAYDEGSDVYAHFEPPAPGARSESLRVLRSTAEEGALRLLLEGLGGRTYALRLKTPHAVGNGGGFESVRVGPDEYRLDVTFDPAARGYTRREVVVPLSKR
ncbi:MAG TPA: hypothetical protein VF611_21965, partial [Pyrinomonadaceae bacterium]